MRDVAGVYVLEGVAFQNVGVWFLENRTGNLMLFGCLQSMFKEILGIGAKDI